MDGLFNALIGGIRIDIAGHPDQHRGQSDEAVQNGYKLRHLGHFDPRRHENTDGGTDNHGQPEDRVIVDLCGRDGRRNGDRHADDAVDIAAARRFLIA